MFVCIKIERFEIFSKKGRFRDIIFRMSQEPRTDIIQWGSNILGENISSLVHGGSQQDSCREDLEQSRRDVIAHTRN